MCLIVFQPLGDEPLSDDILSNGWVGNPHGAGFMFAVEGKLIIRKAFFSLKHLRKAYAADHATYGKDSPFVMHFRWATHGGKGANNVHPHALAGGAVGLVHNGILWDYESFGNVNDSDTVTFCRTVLACRPVDNLMSEDFNKVLAGLIGAGNKLVLMDGAGNVSIVNADEGKWEGSRWYSNSGYLPTVKMESKWIASNTKWTPIPVDRGHVFATTEDAVAGFRRQFGKPELQEIFDGPQALLPPSNSHLSLLDSHDIDEAAYADERPATIDDDIERVEMDIADAWIAGDEHLVSELDDELADLLEQRDHDADEAFAYAMARDGE